MKKSFSDYIEKLYKSQSFEQAFKALESEAVNLGFDGALYTYIPNFLVDTNFNVKPVYHVSENYSPDFITHYFDACFERCDPVIDAVVSGFEAPFSWWGEVGKTYSSKSKEKKEVLDTALHYGVTQGITIPVMSGNTGIAGASFVSSEFLNNWLLEKERVDYLNKCVRAFHGYVLSGSYCLENFVKPTLPNLNKTERALLKGLIKGQAPCQIAYALGKSEGYLEQVMLRLRSKFSGDPKSSKKLNRNQVVYYAGLLNMMDLLE